MEYDRLAPQRQLYTGAQVSSYALCIFGDTCNLAFDVFIHDHQVVPQRIADVSDIGVYISVDRVVVFVNVVAYRAKYDDERIWAV